MLCCQLPNKYMCSICSIFCSSLCSRVKRRCLSAEDTPPAVGIMSCALLSTSAPPQLDGMSSCVHFSPLRKNEESKPEGVENEESNLNPEEQISNVESPITERFELFQEPVETSEEEWHETEESATTETGNHLTPEKVNEELWVLQRQQDELMELMKEVVEERDACKEKLEKLRERCAKLQKGRSQLVNRV